MFCCHFEVQPDMTGGTSHGGVQTPSVGDIVPLGSLNILWSRLFLQNFYVDLYSTLLVESKTEHFKGRPNDGLYVDRLVKVAVCGSTVRMCHLRSVHEQQYYKDVRAIIRNPNTATS